MENEILSANQLLAGTGISILDAARLIRNILDAKNGSSTDNIQFCSKVIDSGKKHLRKFEMQFECALTLYLEYKSYLRKDSLSDINYLSRRLIKERPDFAKYNFSDFTSVDCEDWLNYVFKTPSQFNKARTMLHGFFEFALRRGWCDVNPIKRIFTKKVIEKEIAPLSFEQSIRILNCAKLRQNRDCVVAVGLLLYAGIRPREVRRIKYSDIDLEENCITVRSQCSKTGGVRQVEIYPTLRKLLKEFMPKACDKFICPPNWDIKWRRIRNMSGFKGVWIEDILRHTYASFHAKHFANLPKLQLNMGHRDQSLLRSRYVNMQGISKKEAHDFFN